MSVIWWGTGGGGGAGTCSPLPTFGSEENIISDAPLPPPPPPPQHSHTHCLGWKNHAFQYLFAFHGNFYWTTYSHSLPIFRYSEHVQYI